MTPCWLPECPMPKHEHHHHERRGTVHPHPCNCLTEEPVEPTLLPTLAGAS